MAQRTRKAYEVRREARTLLVYLTSKDEDNGRQLGDEGEVLPGRSGQADLGTCQRRKIGWRSTTCRRLHLYVAFTLNLHIFTLLLLLLGCPFNAATFSRPNAADKQSRFRIHSVSSKASGVLQQL